MKKCFLSFALVAMFSGLAFGQLIDEKNVTITMDMQPVLQLNMSTPDQIDFVFDDIQEYYGGIIKYGATILKVSSSVSWDLYAVGTSQAGVIWDQQMTYSGNNTNAVDALPISLLELRQYEANQYDLLTTGLWSDYSTPFAPAEAIVAGQNSIYYSATPYVIPGAANKYLQGHDNAVAPANGASGGSYLEQAFGTSDYYFTIDYRILPGLPAIFPAAGDNLGALEDLVTINGAGSYAQPGVYTMNVKYVLLEDQ